jgi:hypothetical protein
MKRLLQNLFARTSASSSRRRTTAKPQLELLEDRRVMSVSYHGGPIIHNVHVEPIYYGDAWVNNDYLANQRQQLNNFFTDITDSTYMDMLGEYGVGRGDMPKAFTMPLYQPVTSDGTYAAMTVTDQQIRTMLDQQIYDPTSPVDYPGGDHLYVVFTPPNVDVPTAHDNNFLGYHSCFTDSRGESVYYAVIPHPIGNLTVSGLNDFQQMTEVCSHELAEAVTNPDCSSGWFDDARGQAGEIGDLAGVAQYGSKDGYIVQSEWSKQLGCAVLPGDATWLQWNGMQQQSYAGTSAQAPQSVPVPANLGVVANALTHSDEYYANFLTKAYKNYLGRTPDAAGLHDWITAMKSGVSDEQVEAYFIGSQEYIQNHGGPGAGWVAGMYHDLLGRTPGSDEVAAWVRNFQNGMSPQQVAFFFAASAEREGQRIQSDYQTYLHRQATPDEVNAWVNAFEHGYSNEDVVAGFVGSVENFHQHQDNVNIWLEDAYLRILGRAIDQGSLQTWNQIL